MTEAELSLIFRSQTKTMKALVDLISMLRKKFGTYWVYECNVSVHLFYPIVKVLIVAEQ